MTLLLLAIFGGECVFLLTWGMLRRGRVYEYPFLAGGAFAGFVLPQSIGLTTDTSLPPAALDQTLLMSILCAGMCWLGYAYGGTSGRFRRWQFDRERLVIAGGALSAIGALFYFLISRLPEELTHVGQWTGLPVVYLFFAKLLNYGFAIAVLVYARTQSKGALAIIAFDGLLYFDRIVIAARRGTAVEFCLCLLCALWFGRRWALPRLGVMGMLAAGTLMIYSTGAYRSAVDQGHMRGQVLPSVEDLFAIDITGNFRETLEEGAFEMRNAVYRISAKGVTRDFDLGLSYWNEFIFAYVPAQVVGQDLKDSLMADLPFDAARIYGYEEHPGTTYTGIADSFEAFWFFGCLVFFAIAFAMRRLFERAMTGDIVGQLAYMLILTSALHVITHHTKWFFLPWVHIAVFVLPALLWARKGGTNDGAKRHLPCSARVA